MPGPSSFVLLTAARNEAERIGALLESVVAQTRRPDAWIIVSDRSTDATAAIVGEFAARHPWIVLRRREGGEDTTRLHMVSPGKVGSIRLALDRPDAAPCDFLGILDADVTLPPDYYERVFALFAEDPGLGLAGGGVYNVYEDGEVAESGFIRPSFVGGPVQLFRRACWEDIGGYVDYGHEDVIAVAAAKSKGWGVRCDPSVRALHHGQERPTLASRIPTCYRMGSVDYVMRGSLWFEILRAARRALAAPYVLAGASLLVGYVAAWLRREKRIEVSDELAAFLRKEEREKVGRAVGRSRSAR